MIAHVVLFRPKPDVDEARLRRFIAMMASASEQIPGIERARVGRSINIDPGYSRSMGESTYPYMAILEFTSREALVAYLRHPRHGELGAMFWELCDSTVVSEVELRDFGNHELAEFLVE